MSAAVQSLLQVQSRVVAGTAPRVVRVALAGCGVVGGSLIRLLRERGPSIEREHGVRFDVVGVLVRDVRRPRIVESAAPVITNDAGSWLASDADLVVEATGARDTAYHIARATLAAGRSFVTANKALIAAHGPELSSLARGHGGRLHFEAAVGGGVPIIRVLREALRHTGVRSVRGVLNGTTNYVLSRMSAGEGLDQALYEARLKGFAEADASRDLDGRDAADKIAILAWLAFGSDPSTLQVQRRGVQADAQTLINAARAHDGVLRQVAECWTAEGSVSAAVEPVIVSRTSPFASAHNEENCVLVETKRSGNIRLYGPGAGGPPTAAALLSDMLQASSPEPGPRSSTPLSRQDARKHQWALIAPWHDASPLLRAASAAGVPLNWVKADRATGDVHALTQPATREAVQACLSWIQAECGAANAVRIQTD